MTAKKILDAIGEIRDESILSAENYAETNFSHSRNFTKILLVAILMLVLAVSAIAYFGAGEIFKFFFSENNDEPLSPIQEEYLDETALAIGQSVTSDGWTVTLESAISDQYHAYIKVNIEAPEEVELLERNYFFDSSKLSSKEGSYEASYIRTREYLLPDEDSKTNTVSIMITKETAVDELTNFNFNDGMMWTLNLENIIYKEEQEDVFVCEAKWDFEFAFSEISADGLTVLEFISEPIVVEGKRLMGNTIEVELISLKLTPYGAYGQFRFFDGDWREAIDFDNIFAVMKDGTLVEFSPSGTSITTQDNLGTFYFASNAPLILEELDYVIFPDNIILTSTLSTYDTEIKNPVIIKEESIDPDYEIGTIVGPYEYVEATLVRNGFKLLEESNLTNKNGEIYVEEIYPEISDGEYISITVENEHNYDPLFISAGFVDYGGATYTTLADGTQIFVGGTGDSSNFIHEYIEIMPRETKTITYKIVGDQNEIYMMPISLEIGLISNADDEVNATFSVTQFSENDISIPEEVMQVVIDYNEAFKLGSGHAVEYLHYSDEAMYDVFVRDDAKRLDYEIIASEKINDNLYSFTLLTKTDISLLLHGDIYFEVYHFITKIDGQWYYLNGVSDVPLENSENLDPNKYIYD